MLACRGVSWHGSPARGASYGDPASYPVSRDIRPSAYGNWTYTGPTIKGRWVQQAIADHGGGLNLRFFASPNPVQAPSAAESTVLHWDVSKMQTVMAIEVHAEAASGPLVAKGGKTGTVHVTLSALHDEDFVLIDVTEGARKPLGTVTVETK
jgi:hypothetical protein